MKIGGTSPSVCVCACIYLCSVAKGSNWVQSPLAAWEHLRSALPLSMATNLSGAGTPTAPTLPLSSLACKRSVQPKRCAKGSRPGREAGMAGKLPPCPRPAACSPVAAVMFLRHLHSAACVSSGHAHDHSVSYLWEPVRSPGGWQGVGEHLCSTADPTLLEVINALVARLAWLVVLELPNILVMLCLWLKCTYPPLFQVTGVILCQQPEQ